MTPLKVAIVGSRDYPRLDLVANYVRALPKDTIIISGGARGVDRCAAQIALDCGMGVEIFPADWNRWGKQAGMIRNSEIVRAADRVVAFWDGSNGTANTIAKAHKAGKPVIVFDAQGNEVK